MKQKYSLGAIIFAIILTAVVLIGINELVKSSRRHTALSELNANWPKLKTNVDKIAALTRTNTIMAQNRPMFYGSNSKADEKNSASYEGGVPGWGGDPFGGGFSIEMCGSAWSDIGGCQ